LSSCATGGFSIRAHLYGVSVNWGILVTELNSYKLEDRGLVLLLIPIYFSVRLFPVYGKMGIEIL
jgi:hypothetical protein